mgnify:CR=1 FL=1
MAYIGNTPSANFASVTKDTFSGNASTTAFTLSKTATTNGVAVYVENVRQIPTTAYAVSGTTLTFTGTPPSGTNNIYVMHHNTPVSTATHPAAQDLTAANATVTSDLSVNTIKHTGGTTGLTIDSSGRVLKPARVAFQAGFNNDDTDNVGSTNGTDYRITFTDEVYDFGGNWNGTHTFTAPVTGMYMFYANLYSPYTSDYARLGAALYEGGSLKHKNWNPMWETVGSVNISMGLYLSASAEIDIRMSLHDNNATSNTFQIYRNSIYSNFGGMLIG